MSIKPSRKNAFMKEFPFLREILADFRTVESITVKRMTAELLRIVPSYTEVNGASTSSFSGDEDIYLISRFGTVKKVARASFDYYYTDNCHEQSRGKGYPVGESLVDLTDELEYIVWLTNDMNNYGQQEDGRNVTVYKLPKDSQIEDLVAEYLKREIVLVHAETDL